MWKIQNYDNSQLESMLEMTKEYYGDIEITNHEFIEHEYFSNPNGSAFILLAHDQEKDRLAGQYIVIPAKVRIHGSTYQSVLSLNTLTRSEYRGQNIFITLADNLYRKCTEAGVSFCYGAPNQNSHYGFVAKLGFHDIGTIPLWVKPMKPSALVYTKLKNSLLSSLIKPFDRLFQTKTRKKGNFTMQELTNENQSIAESLWKKIQDKYPVMFQRDSAFLSWRYITMPLRTYKIYVAFCSDEPVGYIVCRITEISDMKCGMIADLLFEGNNILIGEELINTALIYFQKNQVELAGCLMQKHFFEADALRKSGFFVCPKFLEPQPFSIIYKRLNDSIKDTGIEDFKNWFFTMGDYDVI